MKEDKKWRVEAFDDFISIRDERGDEVCYIDDFTDERKAMENARLIEAAPQMRRVLSSIIKDFNTPWITSVVILAWRNEIELILGNEE